MNPNPTSRWPRASVSEWGVTSCQIRNPWVVAFWSFAYPGCGNLIQDRLAKGLILVVWELVVNTNAKLNLGILYTLIGQFDMAKKVIDTRWLLLYVPLYMYGIWDGYRGTVDLNKFYLLSDREDAPLTPFTIKTFDLNSFDKRKPWLAAMWSLLMPGVGYLYTHRVIKGFYFIGWTIVTFYFANALPAIHYSLAGDFSQAKAVLNMQWMMYYPSIIGFVIYDSYGSAVELNKLMEKEQSRWLRSRYQDPDFQMPL